MSELTIHTDAPGGLGYETGDALRAAYIFLQKLVGGIAVALPPVLIIGGLVLGKQSLESSLSAYYYTPMGDVFVGALCALGVFLLSYQHHATPDYQLDNYLSYGASAAAIGVALVPTAHHEATPWTGEWLLSTTHLL